MNRQYIGKNRGLLITILSILLSVVIFLIYGADIMFDEFEHLRASYLVSLGFHPYKDFFEHHHQLLWYLWAPFLKYMPHDQVLLFYFSRILTTLFSLIGAYYIYQTAKRFFGGTIIAVYVLIIYFSFSFVQTMAVVFKPDALMWCFYLCGLYHFFCFIETKNLKPLIIASSSFAISFVFLQTAMFLVLPIAIAVFYSLDTEKELLKKYLLASVPAVIILGIFLIFIQLTSGIVPYYQSNWILNSYKHDLIVFSYLYLPKFLPFILVGYLAYIYQIKKHQATTYTHIMALFLTLSVIKNLLFLSPFPHYFQAEALAISFLLASITPQLPRLAKTSLMIILITFNAMNINTSLYILSNKPYLRQIEIITKDENALVYPPELHIYTPHFPFYWFYPQLASLHNYLFRVAPEFDVTKYVNDKKMDYINILHTTSIIKQESETLYQQFQKQLISPALLESTYELINKDSPVIYKRKPNL